MVREGMMLSERYEIISKIGAGGMSDVYKAHDHKLNRYVAVKILKAEYSENTNFVAKFRTEAQSAAGLMHPNIVNVYDVGEDFGLYYIVMELVEGITLKHYIEKKLRLAVREAVSIAIQVSMGLLSAHDHHVIHRDVKPQNIIISTDGKVKVTDFGIARAASSNTITSNVMGSVHYTSPEQARGGYSDEKSDIYSLGIVLFEMLTGRVPFDGDTTVAIAIKQIQEPMPNPRDFVDDIPLSAEHIIYKCCEKNPDRRYSSMNELIADLKKCLVSPDEDFVKRIPKEGLSGATKMVTDEDVNSIRRQTGGIELDPDILKAYNQVPRKINDYSRPDEKTRAYEEKYPGVASNNIEVGYSGDSYGYDESDYGDGPYRDEDYDEEEYEESPYEDESYDNESFDEEPEEVAYEDEQYEDEEAYPDTDEGILAYIQDNIIVEKPKSEIKKAKKQPKKRVLTDSEEALKRPRKKKKPGSKNAPKRDNSKQKEERAAAEKARKKREREKEAEERERAERARERELRNRIEDDEDDEEDIDPNFQKLMTILGIIAAIIIIVIIVVLVRKIQGLSVDGISGAEAVAVQEETEGAAEEGETGQKVVVEDVSNTMFADAKARLNNQGFTVTSRNEPSESVEKGRVISIEDESGTEISPGSTIDSGSSVVLVVSSGQNGVNVPSVVGLSKAEAKVSLESQGFKVQESEGTSDSVEKGQVISQSPESGQLAETGSTVNIVVSTGAPEAEAKSVPNIVGMTENDAKVALDKAGFSFSSLTEEYSDTVAAGLVVSQDPAAGSALANGSGVSFVISKGPEVHTYGGTINIAAPADYQLGPASVVVTTTDGATVLYNGSVQSLPATVTLKGLSVQNGLVACTYPVFKAVQYEDDEGNIVNNTSTENRTFTQTANFQAE
ncbi:MAG: protein kinase [Lachnospiraceae bacterium]|nr:protein kinase [Lachnospiraceae bacterium]